MRKNSIIPRCASSTSGTSVCTTMPSFITWVEHPACSFGMPSILTRHMRPWPTTDRRGWYETWGIWTPTLMAASTRLVPASTSTVRPLIVTLGTLGYAPFSDQFSRSILEIPPVGEGAGLLLDVAVDLVLEALDERLHRTD